MSLNSFIARHWAFVRDLALTPFTSIRGTSHLIGLNKQMHQHGLYCGKEWERHLPRVEKYIPHLEKYTVLDFGCGPSGGVSQKLIDQTIAYDPCIPEYAKSPWTQPFDILFSTDVLEHLNLSQLKEFTKRVRIAKPLYLYLNISTRRARLRLPNGANAHLTVRSQDWWKDFLDKGLKNSYELRTEWLDAKRSEWSGLYCLKEI